jgi:hypothetical protein
MHTCDMINAMCATRQAALTAAIQVWEDEINDRDRRLVSEEIRQTATERRILHLADVFDTWLSRPGPPVKLVGTVSAPFPLT